MFVAARRRPIGSKHATRPLGWGGLLLPFLIAATGVAFSADPIEAPRPATVAIMPVLVAPGITRHVLIVCGHPGDEEHRVVFLDVVGRIEAAFRDRWAVQSEHLHVLFGQGTEARPAADRESLQAAAARLAQTAAPDDAVWVIVVGHAHFDGRNSWINLPGDDLDQTQFAALFDSLRAKEQVFLLTFPVSGFYVRPLARDGRVVVAATEPGLEINETLFPAALAEVVSVSPPAIGDADADGQRSLFDLYIAVARSVAARYAADEAIPTEHAQLDDDGDGRGTELQTDYLTPEQGGRFTGSPPPPRTTGDGLRAAAILLPAATEPTGG